jgi:site-specific recombinase XerD
MAGSNEKGGHWQAVREEKGGDAMLLERAFEDFIEYHEIDNQSRYTIRNYRECIGSFIEWLRGEHSITDTDDLKVAHLRGWLGYLQKTPGKGGEVLKDSTIHLWGVSALAFCHWLEQEGIVAEPITKRFKLPRTEQEFIPTFTAEEVQKLFDVCEDDCKHCAPLVRKALTVRNRAILAILIDTGIRLSELVNLRLCDIDKELRLLVVHRKGNKWQQVPITRDGFKFLHEYLSKHRKHLAEVSGRTTARKDDAVFLSRKGEPITIHSVQKLFARLKERTGIDGKRVSPHNCRRYMATTQLAMGRSPLDVQRQMGNTTLRMTNHYASLTVEQLQRSHEQFSPLRVKDSGNNQAFGTGYWDE